MSNSFTIICLVALMGAFVALFILVSYDNGYEKCRADTMRSTVVKLLSAGMGQDGITIGERNA